MVAAVGECSEGELLAVVGDNDCGIITYGFREAPVDRLLARGRTASEPEKSTDGMVIRP